MDTQKINLLILNGPPDRRDGFDPRYRGTYRSHPTYCDSKSGDDEVNKLFLWFLQEGGELGLVHDPEKAILYANLLNRHSPKEQQFEVVEVVDGNAPSKSGGQFLGFDLSSGYNSSLLSSGLQPPPSTSALPEPIRELVGLLARCYSPKLNQSGLFDTLLIAQECLRSMDAIQALRPNLFEGVDLRTNFQPTGVYVVPLL